MDLIWTCWIAVTDLGPAIIVASVAARRVAGVLLIHRWGVKWLVLEHVIRPLVVPKLLQRLATKIPILRS